MLTGTSESAKQNDLHFQELRLVRFKKNNARWNSRNHDSKIFTLSGTPLSGIQKVLYLMELHLVIFKMI